MARKKLARDSCFRRLIRNTKAGSATRQLASGESVP